MTGPRAGASLTPAEELCRWPINLSTRERTGAATARARLVCGTPTPTRLLNVCQPCVCRQRLCNGEGRHENNVMARSILDLDSVASWVTGTKISYYHWGIAVRDAISSFGALWLATYDLAYETFCRNFLLSFIFYHAFIRFSDVIKLYFMHRTFKGGLKLLGHKTAFTRVTPPQHSCMANFPKCRPCNMK